MKKTTALLFSSMSACVMHQHLGALGDKPDADAGVRVAEAGSTERDVATDMASIDVGNPDTPRDFGAIDVGTIDAQPDVTIDGSRTSTASASCMTSCTCEAADTCRLQCTGGGCVATCGNSRACTVRLEAKDNRGDCRLADSCDVTCGASCLVECGSSRCKIACAPGQACAVKCGTAVPLLCPDGVTVVCNGRDC